MQTITDEALAGRIAGKAPVWCQDVIYALDRQLAEARKQVERLSGGPEDSNVRVRDHVNPDRLLGRNTEVSFDLPAGTVVIRPGEDGALEVYCTGPRRDHYPQIMPSTANTFLIRLGER